MLYVFFVFPAWGGGAETGGVGFCGGVVVVLVSCWRLGSQEIL